MIVVTIVIILAGIGVPYYLRYMQEGRKAEAYAVLDAAIAGSRVYYLKNRTYENSTFETWNADDDVDHSNYFTYSLSGLSDAGYTARATVEGTWGPAGATITWTMDSAKRPSAPGLICNHISAISASLVRTGSMIINLAPSFFAERMDS